MNAEEIAARVKNGGTITDQEKAFLLRNNAHAMSAFMIDNNPGSVNLALRRLGYDHLGFYPDPKQLARQMDLLIERKDTKSWAYVVQNFNLIPDHLTPSFITEFTSQFAQ